MFVRLLVSEIRDGIKESVVEHSPSMPDALGSIPSTKTNQTRKTKTEKK